MKTQYMQSQDYHDPDTFFCVSSSQPPFSARWTVLMYRKS